MVHLTMGYSTLKHYYRFSLCPQTLLENLAFIVYIGIKMRVSLAILSLDANIVWFSLASVVQFEHPLFQEHI